MDSGIGTVVGKFASQAIVEGNPAIAYYDETNGDLLYVRASNAYGTAWGVPVVVDAQSSQINLDESFATGSLNLKVVNGNPALAYQEGAGPSSFETTNVYFARATDASGTTWGAPQNLTPNRPSQGYYARLEVANGLALIVDIQGSQGGMERFRASDANGASWSGTGLVTPDQNWAPAGYPLYTGVNLSSVSYLSAATAP